MDYREKKDGYFGKLFGKSPKMVELFQILSKIAGSVSSTTILINGESGSGKQLAAQAIHSYGERKKNPFVEINCAAIPEALLESELFGHVKGAFTDARDERHGLFQLAKGGTLFLDEIGEMPLSIQAKLLKVIEDKKIRKLGGMTEIMVDVRIIAATNKDLVKEVAEARFRDDLFWRLNVVPITMPSLRERREDIEPLARIFLDDFNKEMRRQFTGFTKDAINALESYNWPGNVRELRNIVERCILLENGPLVTSKYIMAGTKENVRPNPEQVDLEDENFSIDDYLGSIEKKIMIRALEKSNGNQAAAARILNLSREILRYRMKKHSIIDHSKES